MKEANIYAHEKLIRKVSAEDFTSLAPGEILRCPECKCIAYYREGTTRMTAYGPTEVKACFYSDCHEQGCPNAIKGTHQPNPEDRRLELTQLGKILSDKEPADRGESAHKNKEDKEGDEEEQVDFEAPTLEKKKAKGYTNAKAIYEALKEADSDTLVGYIPKNKFLIDESTIDKYRNLNLHGLHEIVARPCSPRKLEHPIDKPYKSVFLRDAYTDYDDEKNTIFYQLDFVDDRVFLKWLDNLKNVPYDKVIVAIGEFSRVENENYMIYRCRIKNSKSIGIAKA